MQPVSEIAFFPALLKIVAALAVVLGIMAAALLLVKRLMNRPGLGGSDDSLIQIVSTRALGPKSSVVLLSVLDRVLVVGLSGGQLTLLARINDAQAVAKLKNHRPSGPASLVLPELLRRNLTRVFDRPQGGKSL